MYVCFDINISKKDTEKWRRQYYSIDEAMWNIEFINILTKLKH